ncbi:MAG: MATE family efflux transporter [Alphaproteobacteria bacterium]|nr:MATE family efflux transporter [Alphaproteobacteria bacterium]
MRYSYKKIIEISWPILAGLFIQQLVGLADTAFLGRVGTVELGASALAGVFYIMIFMLALGFGTGIQIIVARRNGEQNFHKIGGVVYQGISFLVCAAVIIIALTIIFAPYVLNEFILSQVVYEKTLAYLNIRIYGFLFAFPIVVFRAFFIGITQTKILTYNAILLLIINVILNYVLIFGKFGFSPMGIEGAALASIIAEAVAAIYLAIYMFTNIDLNKYGFCVFVFFNKNILVEILALSIWTMLQYFVSMATWFLFLVAIENLGEEPLAISNILRSVTIFPYMIITALAAAANSVTSNLIGQGHDFEVEATSLKVIKLSYIMTFTLIAIMIIFPYPILRIYTDSKQVIENSILPYYSALSSFITMIPGMILLSVVSGTGQTKTAMYIELLVLVFYCINVWYVVMYLQADLYICWMCEHSYNILLSLFTYWYLKRNKWCCKIV